ncbi:hypothetical protein QEZ54_33245 [Catellatospora sp. KI3]|uniref:hypothetical protein n=1 Tax=Catellatospora sp. KI3 TaxID=3041620 RepID=UPI0024823A10|nr:hypothetical protein [Catellatospora sp. KI3]MDI1465850.1 hypothetical protein [Catellatospora sp. KI3]
MKLRLTLAALAILAGLGLAVAPSPVDAPAAADEAGSAVTVTGTGRWANLSVTVDTTEALVNQTVHLTWTGGAPTTPDYGRFDTNFLQIMQCWGDEATPQREKCQFGGLYTDTRGGSFANSRQVDYGSTLVDPEEVYAVPTKRFVPFRSATGAPEVIGSRNEFFDANTTNEIPYARIRPDGTGEAFFEVQTVTEAPGLGCGEVPDGGGDPRACWLVIVPRADAEVDGTSAASQPDHRLVSSALSASNFAHALSVRLTFQPVGTACTIGVNERRMVGHEPLREAVNRWQRSLCTPTTVFGYSQVSDDTARRQVVSADPGMVFAGRAVDPDTVDTTRPLVYAPVAVSGVVVAFNVERSANPVGDPQQRLRDGERITDLKLTPRLVAKLLTQSYRFGAFFAEQELAGNPPDMTEDEEFLLLNPELRQDSFLTALPDALMPLIPTDAAGVLWAWINGDAQARAFLDGTPDEHGMVVNPHYKELVLPRYDFPKQDPFCDAGQPGTPCTQDAHPYSTDFHDGARAAGRGDTLARYYDTTSDPVAWKKIPPQLGGLRAVLTVTDSASAARYGLPVAKLRNAAGQFVAPTAQSLLAGVASMIPTAVPNVVSPNPNSTDAAAYPLTTVSFAATAPKALTKAAGRDYATFLRYAVGDGQLPGVGAGQLPEGYAPLPDAMRTATRTAAAKIEKDAGTGTVASPSPTRRSPSPSHTPAGTGSGSGTGSGQSAAPLPSPSRTDVGLAPLSATPAQPTGFTGRYALAALLILGGLAGAVGPLLARRPKARPTEGGAG